MYLVKKQTPTKTIFQELWIDEFRAEVRRLSINASSGENEGATVEHIEAMDAKCTKALPIEVCKSEGHEGITQIKYFELAEDRYLAVTLRPDPLTNEPTLSQTAYIHEGFETTVFTPSEWVKNVINETLNL